MFGLYLHVPYCLAKCHYCDFNSRAPLDGESFDPYVRALCADVAGQVSRPVDTLFVGGGTPSILSGSQMTRIMASVQRHFDVVPGAEVTMEANPGTVDQAKLDECRAAGINRLSIGVQARQDHLLRRLGRQHDWPQCEAAVRQARAAGFEQVSLDLMYGLPGQTVADWDESLQACLGLVPDHLSTYSLIVEEHTTFGALAAQGRLSLPAEEEEEAMAAITQARCEAAGLTAYEVSNWARGEAVCRHNLLYWNNDEYLGLGAGAVSYVDGWRWTRVRRPETYIQRVLGGHDLFESGERVSDWVSWQETVSLGLRRFDGLDLAGLERHHELPVGCLQATWRAEFAAEEEAGLVIFDTDRMRLSWEGMRLASHFMVRMMAYCPLSEQPVGPAGRQPTLAGPAPKQDKGVVTGNLVGSSKEVGSDGT
ncbi:MAG TPA: radical SAM family heme chaperone HemW [Candidatus Xenobia bacterium]|jgi:oxygen-independent coproporphyrinogen-3 oxidase